MNGYATWLADVLRGAGLKVIESPGWQSRGHYGGYTNLDYVVWHHDASPIGDSPGVVGSMLARWDTAAGACWVDRYGVWHLLAAGPAYHAGAVLPGKPGNHNSLGVETDHTVGEDWPFEQLNSMRVGTAAILKHLGQDPAKGLEFHKTICSPPGRKIDPAGLDLTAERQEVAGGFTVAPAPRHLGDRVLGHGDSGSDVVELQSYFQNLSPDGIFGDDTDAAVRAFQAANGLEVDGLVGPNTVNRLRGVPVASAPTPPPAPPAPTVPQIAVDGALGPETIRRWQQVMGTPVDGVISNPSVLIRAVQVKIGAGVDGLIGPNTIRALQRYLGTPVDGVLSHPKSMVIEALQRRLNENRF